MNHVVALPGFEGQRIEVEPSGVFRGPKLLVDGEPAGRGNRRGDMILRRKDGTEAVARWQPQAFGLDVPQLIVDGTAVQVVEPLPWYVWLWCALPLVLILLGGALGGVAGAVAGYVNVKLFRTNLPGLVKILFTVVVGVVATVIYLLVALMLMAAIGR